MTRNRCYASVQAATDRVYLIFCTRRSIHNIDKMGIRARLKSYISDLLEVSDPCVLLARVCACLGLHARHTGRPA